MLIEQTKNKCSIWAEIISSCSPATDEWMSECRVFKNQQLIGTLDDGILGNEICIRGIFDYTENGKDKEGIPNLIDNAFYLSIEDLIALKEIVEHWVDEDGETHKEKWEKVE